MNREVLFGLLLGYPLCCIEAFTKDKLRAKQRQSHSGFIPCEEHENSHITTLLGGRHPAIEPEEFLEFLETDLSYRAGVETYMEFGKEGFFELCWRAASI